MLSRTPAANTVLKFQNDEEHHSIDPYFEQLSMERICWSPLGTSRQLIQDADDEELRRPLHTRASQEQTTIFATIDCREGAVQCYLL